MARPEHPFTSNGEAEWPDFIGGMHEKYRKTVRDRLLHSKAADVDFHKKANELIDLGAKETGYGWEDFFSARVGATICSGVLARAGGEQVYTGELPIWSVERRLQYTHEEGTGSQWVLPLVLPEIRRLHDKFATLCHAPHVREVEVELDDGVRLSAHYSFINNTELPSRGVQVELRPEVFDPENQPSPY
jgi:hypothetical protein